MKQFSLLVRVPVTYTTEQAREVNPKWNNTIEQWKNKGVYVVSFAFPGESFILAGEEKSIIKGAVVSDGLRTVSNLVVRAETVEEAIELAKDCPILPYGGTVEIREIPNAVTQVFG